MDKADVQLTAGLDAGVWSVNYGKANINAGRHAVAATLGSQEVMIDVGELRWSLPST